MLVYSNNNKQRTVKQPTRNTQDDDICALARLTCCSHLFPPQRLQVPSLAISKCAACLKPPLADDDKLKRCMRCYRVGYCNQ